MSEDNGDASCHANQILSKQDKVQKDLVLKIENLSVERCQGKTFLIRCSIYIHKNVYMYIFLNLVVTETDKLYYLSTCPICRYQMKL